MDNEASVIGLFPTPLYHINLGNILQDKEINFFESIEYELPLGVGCSTSKNHYILEDPQLERLKAQIQKNVEHYFDTIIQPSTNVQPYFTQSWTTSTENNENNHRHYHMNSIVSGVFYYDVDENTDSITFSKPETETIKIVPSEYNAFNSAFFDFKVKKNDLILFPSTLFHMVKYKKGDSPRVCLAFNVFVKGTIGSYDSATELFL